MNVDAASASFRTRVRFSPSPYFYQMSLAGLGLANADKSKGVWMRADGSDELAASAEPYLLGRYNHTFIKLIHLQTADNTAILPKQRINLMIILCFLMQKVLS